MESIYTHAKRIEELHDHQMEIARDEGKAFEDYTPRELIATAFNLIDIMEDRDEDSCTKESRRQLRLLRNFVQKWRPTI